MSVRSSLIVPIFMSMMILPQLAQALDLDKIEDELPDAPVIEPIDEGTGWYLRGDIGVNAHIKSGASSFNTYSAANGYRDGVVTGQSLKGDQVDVGFGVGFKINDLFRADATIDVLRGQFNQTGNGVDTCAGAPANTSCAISGSASATNYMLMANAYVDLATVSGFTPYVGAGLGATQVNWTDANVTGSCVDGVGACGATPDVSSIEAGQKSWRTTWALMAGVSYDLSDRMKLDLGYRYSRIASGELSKDADGALRKDGGFDNHQVRAGIRVAGF